MLKSFTKPARCRRGRNGGYPPSPAQIPACSFPALGSSEIRRFRSRNTSRVCHCHQGGWHCFSDPSPDNVSFDGYVSCQPLPHVSGFPALGVLWVDPTSYRPSAVLLWVGLAYLLMDKSVEEELIGDPTFLTSLCTLATL